MTAAASAITEGPAPAPTTSPRITVVLLSYNRPAYLAKALNSIFRQTGASLEVVVVDNLSPASPEVAAEVARYDRRVCFLPQPVNRGFTGGMNVGLSAATGDFLHLTEDDIVLDDGFYEELLRCPQANDSSSLLSGVIRHPESADYFYAGASLNSKRCLVQYARAPADPDRPFRTGMLVGAMIFGRKEAFAQVGPFRDEYFLYGEDVELSYRAGRRGVSLWLIPSARATHLPAGPWTLRPFIEYHKLKNYMATNWLYAPVGWAGAATLLFFIWTAPRMAWRCRAPLLLLKVWGWALVNSPRYALERLRPANFSRSQQGPHS